MACKETLDWCSTMATKRFLASIYVMAIRLQKQYTQVKRIIYMVYAEKTIREMAYGVLALSWTVPNSWGTSVAVGERMVVWTTLRKL